MRRILLSVCFAISALGQTFEVASFKLAVIPTTGGVYFGPPARRTGDFGPGADYPVVSDVDGHAHDRVRREINRPSWISSERYNVAAKVAEKVPTAN